jgi:hypothetical protein
MIFAVRMMLACWLLLGLPLFVLISLWAGSFWLPFPVPTDESASYYVAWLIAFTLVYALPLAALIVTLRERRKRRP